MITTNGPKAPLMGKAANLLMKHGKKSKAERIIFEAFSQARQGAVAQGAAAPQSAEGQADGRPRQHAGQREAEALLSRAINNVKPVIEIKSVRIAGTTYKVPAPIRWERQKTLAMRWIIEAARGRSGSMSKKLALELIDALKKQGTVIKRRDVLYQEAEHNRAFSHYRW